MLENNAYVFPADTLDIDFQSLSVVSVYSDIISGPTQPNY